MWIRSQNKRVLMDCSNILIADTGDNIAEHMGDGTCMKLGEYTTEKRCLEVLDEIQMAIISGKKAFLMPEE